MRFPYDTPPDSSHMSKDDIRAYNARVASWVYNDELRAAEATLPLEERETRREARRASARKYRENNRDNLARRERKRRHKERNTPQHQEKLRLLREKRREEKQRKLGAAELPFSGQSASSSTVSLETDLLSSLVEYSSDDDESSI
ncbi:hypothetical protein B0H11DRAFT_1924469 [Mycena galericulata]|nr:hypothetical protein B0H11DRAFT_1924469 [Mycena galericulata]